MKKIFLACNHDRHTDDKYMAFEVEENAKNQCRLWMEHWKESVEENRQYGDWCLIISDDYFSFVQEIDLG